MFILITEAVVVESRRTDNHLPPPPNPPSITYMTIHDPTFVGGDEHWANGSLDLEKRYRLGSEVTSLSLSRSSSSEKNDPLDNLNLNFRLTSSMR